MPSSPGSILVDPSSQTAVVTFTLPGGGTPTAYTDRTGTSAISLPASITVPTVFYFVEATQIGVSILVGGVQVATASGAVRTVDLSAGGAAQVTASTPATGGNATYPQKAGTETISGAWTFSTAPSGLTKTTVGLGNVDNTADTAKPVSTAQQTALNLKADLASPALTGTPTAPTAAAATNTTQVATTAFATTALALKADLASPALTGSPTAPTQAAADNSTKLATTAYVDAGDGLLVPKSLVTTKGDLFVATASGTIVRKGVGSDGQVLTADAASTGGMKWAAAAGGGSTQGLVQFMQSGRYYTTIALGTLSGIGQGPGESRLVPIWVDTAITVAELSIEVTTAGAGGFQRLAIYGTTSGLPGTLILDAGQVSAATTGVKTITVSQALSSGLYWLGQACQGAINYVQMAAGGATSTPGVAGTALSTAQAFSAYRNDAVTAAFPGTFSITSVAVQAPRIWIKVA